MRAYAGKLAQHRVEARILAISAFLDKSFQVISPQVLRQGRDFRFHLLIILFCGFSVQWLLGPICRLSAAPVSVVVADRKG